MICYVNKKPQIEKNKAGDLIVKHFGGSVLNHA